MTASFHREFLGWDEPALAGAIPHLLEGTGSEGAIDLSNRIIVVPGGRAGRRLRELLVEAAESRGRPLRPPRIVTQGALPELLYRPTSPPPPPLLARLAWVAELVELPSSSRDLLVAEPPGADDLPGWVQVARLIESLHREIGAELLDFGDVATACGHELLYDDGERWEVLAGLQEDVRGRLRAEGWEDREAARRAALARSELEAPGEVWLLAVPELSRSARKMLGALEGTVRVLVHAPPEEADGFRPDGTVRTEEWAERALPLEEGEWRVVGAPVEQADVAIRFLAALEGTRSPEEVTLGIPDPEVAPYLAQRLDVRGVPFRIAAGRGLARTGPYLLVDAIRAYVRDSTPGALAELLRHPHLATWLRSEGLDSERTIRALDDYRERALPAIAGRTRLPGGPRVRGRNRAERLRQRLEGLVEPWRSPARLRSWADRVVDLMETLYGSRPIEGSGEEERELEGFALELRRVLDELEEGPGRYDPQLPGADALGLLLGEVADGAVPPPGEASAVEMLGWLELHLDDAPVLVLTGVNDGTLPESSLAHPFLPDGLRVRLGISGQRDRRARDTYRLAAILNSRERCLLLSGTRSAAGDPLRPSPLVLQGSARLAAERIRRHYEGAEGDPGTMARPAAARSEVRPGLDRRSRLPCPPEPELRPPPLPLRVRVTSFRDLLADPYRWLLARKVDSDWVDDDRRELDPMGFGILAHEVLECLGTELREERDRDRLASGLRERLHDLVRGRFGSALLPSVRIQVLQLETRMEALAAVEAAERAAGWEVIGVEASPPAEGVPFPVDRDVIFLTGRIDRVDRHPELGVRLLDYKSSERASTPEDRHRRKRDREWVDLQLPLYRHLSSYLEGVDAAAPSVSTGFFNLPRNLEEIGISMAGWSPEELDEADEAARAALRPILAGDPIRPDPEAPGLRRESALAPLFGLGLIREPASPSDADEGCDGA